MPIPSPPIIKLKAGISRSVTRNSRFAVQNSVLTKIDRKGRVFRFGPVLIKKPSPSGAVVTQPDAGQAAMRSVTKAQPVNRLQRLRKIADRE